MKLSLLHDQYKRGELLQGRIMAINKTTGVISVFIRNGLTTTATYLYDINELRVGGLVLIGVVSGSYVILNRLCNNPSGQSFSMRKPRTAQQLNYIYTGCGDAVYQLSTDLALLQTIPGFDPWGEATDVIGNPNTRKIYFCTSGGHLSELDVDTLEYREIVITDRGTLSCIAVDVDNNIIYCFANGFLGDYFYKIDPTNDTITDLYENNPRTFGSLRRLFYNSHHNILLGIANAQQYWKTQLIRFSLDPFSVGSSWDIADDIPLDGVRGQYCGCVMDTTNPDIVYLNHCEGHEHSESGTNYISGIYKLNISNGIQVIDSIQWDAKTVGDAYGLSINGSKLYVGLQNWDFLGYFAEIDINSFSGIDRSVNIDPQDPSEECMVLRGKFDDKYAYVACGGTYGYIVKVELSSFTHIGTWYSTVIDYFWFYDCVLMSANL